MILSTYFALCTFEKHTWGTGTYISGFGDDEKQNLSATLESCLLPKYIIDKGQSCVFFQIMSMHRKNTVVVLALWVSLIPFLRKKKSGPSSLKNRQEWIITNRRFGIGNTLTSILQNKELLKNGETKLGQKRERRCLLHIINHHFHNEYSLPSAFSLIKSFTWYNFTWYLLYPPGSVFDGGIHGKQNSSGSCTQGAHCLEEQTLNNYTSFSGCIKFESWIGSMKEKWTLWFVVMMGVPHLEEGSQEGFSYKTNIQAGK